MPVGRVGARAIVAAGEETLEGRGVDAGLAKLARRLGSRGESFDHISARFRTFPNRLECRCFACAGQTLQAVDAV